MIYLTQARVDFATASRLHLRDSYDWHQAVWKAFPGREEEARDFLTRLDSESTGFRLLVVSPSEPSRPDWCPQSSDAWKTKLIPDAFFHRGRYAFQLCANPTRKVDKEGSDGTPTKNGRRVPLSTREDLAAWILRKAAEGGFAVEEDSLLTYSRGRSYFSQKGRRGLHSAVEFRGRLVVNDPVKFRETFLRGIGPAKAFGFGLLVVEPIS